MTVENLAEREEAVRLFEAFRAAEAAYDAHPLTLHIQDYGSGEVARCAKTGIPLVSGDEVVEDLTTNEVYLRLALGLPPRATEDEDFEEEEEADLEIEAA